MVCWWVMLLLACMRLLTTRVTHMLSRTSGSEEIEPTIESEINEVNELVLGRTEETLTNRIYVEYIYIYTRTRQNT